MSLESNEGDSKQVSKRILFDQIAFNVLSYLDTFSEVCDIDFDTKEGNLNHEFSSWERKNAPYKLPSDLKAFYSIFNGISVRWKVKVGALKVQVGEILLNSLDSIHRHNMEGHHYPVENGQQSLEPRACTAFSLDSKSEYGQILLVYKQVEIDTVNTRIAHEDAANKSSRRPSFEDPEIWFQDTSSRWHFVSITFTHFMRVMITHLGIIGWQMAYSSEGLPECTQHWMRLFCLERLCVDLHWQTTRKLPVIDKRRSTVLDKK